MDYVLWRMTIGQVIMYHNIGIEMKYPDPNKTETYENMAPQELRAERDRLRALYGSIDG
jgi:hypothetical protein